MLKSPTIAITLAERLVIDPFALRQGGGVRVGAIRAGHWSPRRARADDPHRVRASSRDSRPTASGCISVLRLAHTDSSNTGLVGERAPTLRGDKSRAFFVALMSAKIAATFPLGLSFLDGDGPWRTRRVWFGHGGILLNGIVSDASGKTEILSEGEE